MSAAQLFLPASRAFNSNGLPVAGAVLKLYTTGTLVPQPMYSDSALTISLGSTVTANAAGRFDTIYQDNATPFRLRIEDALGAELDDIDPFYFGQMDVSLDTIYPAAVGLFTGMSTLSIPTGIDIVSTTGYSVADKGSAIYVYDATVDSTYVAANPRSSFLSANLRGFRLSIEQDITPQIFGAVADGVTDDSAAFVAAIAALKAQALNAVTYHSSSPKLFIPAGHYYLGTTTLDITHTLVIEGEGGLRVGAVGSPATKLRWAANTTGIRIQAYNTSGASTIDGVTHTDGSFSLFRNLSLFGPFTEGSSGTLSEGEYHGFHIKATAFFENVSVESFQGDGFHANTTSLSGVGTTEGYSNASSLYNCSATSCRAGLFIAGADGNVWLTTKFNAISNRACGIDDQSFLGNTHLAPHTSANGCTADNLGTTAFPSYVVSNSGNRYCVIQGQETAASTNAPSGTTADNAYWYYMGAGGVNAGIGMLAWVSGIKLRCGAPYRTNNANAQNRFYNPYEEGNQGLSQFVSPTKFDGGLHGLGAPKGTGVYERVVTGYYTVDKMSVTTTFNGEATNWDFGPQTAAVSDNAVNYNTTDTNITVTYKTWTAGTPTIQYTQTINKTNGVIHNARVAQYFNVGGSSFIILGATTMGFFGGFGTAKPTITGSRGANAALADLLTKLAALGLITDSSS